MCKLIIFIVLIIYWVVCGWFLIGSWESNFGEFWLINKFLKLVGIRI